MAETAYTAQDVPLALNFFLRAVEMMADAADESGNGSAGAITRGWYGVKLVSVMQNIFPIPFFLLRLPLLYNE